MGGEYSDCTTGCIMRCSTYKLHRKRIVKHKPRNLRNRIKFKQEGISCSKDLSNPHWCLGWSWR